MRWKEREQHKQTHSQNGKEGKLTQRPVYKKLLRKKAKNTHSRKQRKSENVCETHTHTHTHTHEDRETIHTQQKTETEKLRTHTQLQRKEEREYFVERLDGKI
jgi:hypothetical protein